MLLMAPLLACTPQTHLKDLSGGELALSFVDDVGEVDGGVGPRARLIVYIHPDRKRPGPDEPQRPECPKLSMNIKASFNGVPLKRLTGIYAFGDLTYDRACMLELAFPGELDSDRGGPEVELAGPIPMAARAPAAGLLRIEDGSATWKLSVPDAFTTRTLTLESPPGPGQPTLRRGDRVVLRWSPATDVQGRPMGLRLQPPGRPLEEAVTVESAALTIDGDRLSFTVPSDVPEQLNGPVELQLLGPYGFAPKLLGCPVKKCQVWISPRLPPLRATLR
jgi:hypothetical protein